MRFHRFSLSKRRAGFGTALLVSFAVSLSSPQLFADGIDAKFGLSPDNSLNLFLSTLDTAKENGQILINTYFFTHPDMVTKLKELIKDRGVSVEMLIEGEPMGKGVLHSSMSKESVKALNEIQQEMDARDPTGDRNHIWIMQTPNRGERRYVYDHAKYLVVDSDRVLVSSENFVQSAFPTSGNRGNRGWQVVLEDLDLAKKFRDMFKEDSSLSYGDVIDLNGYKSKHPDLPSFPPRPPVKRDQPSLPLGEGSVDKATLITAPDNALDELPKLIERATKRLDVEENDLPKTWGYKETKVENPLVTAIIQAAQSSVQVRVLLHFSPPPADAKEARKSGNQITVEYLQHVARCKKWTNLHARLIHLDATGFLVVHNKGIIVDDEVLVSSINGTENSVKNNRETGVLLESRDAAKYYGKAFDDDWKSSPEVADDPNTPCN